MNCMMIDYVIPIGKCVRNENYGLKKDELKNIYTFK